MKIICFGDSNTYGYDPRGILDDRYPFPWPSLLTRSSGHRTVNLGLNGREIPDSDFTLQLLDRHLDLHLPADLLIILLGTNDLMKHTGDTAGLVRKRMQILLDHLTANYPRLPILLLVPPRYIINGVWEILAPYPEEIPYIYQELAQEFNDLRGVNHAAPIYLADCSQWNLPLAFDGVHLSEKGHQLLAGRVEETLASLE